MIRKEFIDIVTNTGMATLKEMRRLSMGRDDEINEFELLQMPYFDENKFAKISFQMDVSHNTWSSWIDDRNMYSKRIWNLNNDGTWSTQLTDKVRLVTRNPLTYF